MGLEEIKKEILGEARKEAKRVLANAKKEVAQIAKEAEVKAHAKEASVGPPITGERGEAPGDAGAMTPRSAECSDTHASIITSVSTATGVPERDPSLGP